MKNRSRNTGYTTRMLINMFSHMFRDNKSTTFFVVTPHGIYDCEYLMDKVRGLFDVLGIKYQVDGLKIKYEFRWNGEFLFVRTIQFASKTLFENNRHKWTRGKHYQLYENY